MSRHLGSSGLRFFGEGESAAFRRRRVWFLALYLLVFLGVTVPAVPQVWSGRPSLLGLPLAFVWVIFALLVIFCALLALYRSDLARDDTSRRGD